MITRTCLAVAAASAAMLASAAAEPLLVSADRYLDVERGRYVSPANILIEDGRILSLNPTPEQRASADVISLGNATILPGLIDMHTHLAFDIAPGWETEPVRWTESQFALRGARNAGRTVEAGFTTVRELGGPEGVSVGLATAVEQGWITGPRIVPGGVSLSVTGGHCENTGWAPGILEGSPRTGVADGADEFLEATRYQIKHGAEVIKVCATAGVLSFEKTVGAQQMTIEEMRAVVEEAERHGMRVAAHAHGTEGIIAASEAGIHSIEHASVITPEAARILKKNGTWIVPTLYLATAIDFDSLPPAIADKAREVLPLADQSFQLAIREGLKIAFGTDAAVYPHGDNAKELTRRVELGQSEIEALRSATLYAAQLLDVDDRGRIAEGLLADIIAVQGDPLADITVMEEMTLVIKGGEIIVSP